MRILRVGGPSTRASLCEQLDISQSAFSRLAKAVRGDIIVAGRGRSTRYAARRRIKNVGMETPVYEVSPDGSSSHVATLHGAYPAGYYLESHSQAVEAEFYADLPYFLHDMRPAGFLGRLVPARHPELQLPEDLRLWSADNCLHYLSRFGWNSVGSFILGDEAFRLYLAMLSDPQDIVEMEGRAARYVELAESVLEAGTPGSSAGGEQPKFLATLAPDLPVLVKFSPPMRDDVSVRIGDLLICEHIALGVLRENGREAADSELVIERERVFLEVARFDRVGLRGRIGVVSLRALDAQFVGTLGSWSETTAALLAQGVVSRATLEDVQWLEMFSNLIANTDMHPYNLAFSAQETKIGGLTPAYDILPMLYAPQQGEILQREFVPTMPTPREVGVWSQAREAARDFWARASNHASLSTGFRSIARENLTVLERLEYS